MTTIPDIIENRTFDELVIGESASLTHTLQQRDIELFAIMSGDVNPAHVDPEFAKSDLFHQVIAHGMWGGALISTVLGTMLPGPGTIYLGQSLRFHHPVVIGDTITVRVRVAEKTPEKRRVKLDCEAINQKDEVVISGSADVIAPKERITRPRVTMPQVAFQRPQDLFRAYIAKAHALCAKSAPVRTGIVHPVDAAALEGALDAADAGLIIPVFIGPEKKIRAAAEAAKLDICAYELVATAHSHAAAERAVAEVHTGNLAALMKGSLHTDELMHAVVDSTHGLRTGRRMSHVFVLDVPAYPRALLISDAAINVRPDLDAKRDIVQNAIDLAHALGLEAPRVALLSAVETVNPTIPSTLDAASLCKMAERGQITGGILDGPLAFDNAVSEEAAQAKQIVSPVAGKADILIVPDLVSGNMLAKQLEYLAEAEVAGVVLGARVPIILTSRADKAPARLASTAIAVLFARAKAGV